MDHRRRQAEFMAPFAGRKDDYGFADRLMFPPRAPVGTQLLTGVSPFTAYVCDQNTGAGLSLSLMDHDPILTSFFANLDRDRDRD